MVVQTLPFRNQEGPLVLDILYDFVSSSQDGILIVFMVQPRQILILHLWSEVHSVSMSHTIVLHT
jgi:hypothetical protein